MAHEQAPVVYQLTIFFSGLAFCSCPDFSSRGGACKHLRAALIQLDVLRARNYNLPVINLPNSEQQARQNLTSLALQAVTSDSNMSPAHDNLPTSQAVQKLDGLLGAGVMDNEMSEDEASDPDAGLGSDDLDSSSISMPSDDGDFNFTLPSHSAQSAVAQQALSRVIFKLNASAPRLAELGNYLAGVSSLPQTHSSNTLENAKTALENIRLLTDQLDRLISGANVNGSPLLSQSSQPLITPRKRKADPLPTLGPSPEKTQRRKDSYSWH
ncbi:hypothetical protein GGU10DRAFT_381892 [Lentinula aff. detonsa]|uniref:SWIM-type domain-containing protein n=1 Tax=Lentinula aff. detonsa TaxID=2804958 RepID=A0AA38KW33_9AGAR|nr:hypothetical protein GGU10DRAFT_381892 [Lentinula aff. detonsa]